MSRTTVLARQAKLCTDQAISRAYQDRQLDSQARSAFAELLEAVRARSELLKFPTILGERVLEVEALANLARSAAAFIRTPASWPGSGPSLHAGVGSLAKHLLAGYSLPAVLTQVWWGGDGPEERRKRRWFIEHGKGRRFRDLDLPIKLTRRMESRFLASPPHLSVEAALRRAELEALGAPPGLRDAVLATRLGEDLSHGPFWRTVLQFFVREAAHLEPRLVQPIVELLHTIRHRRTEILTPEGLETLDPPCPGFSMRGRTLSSILRMLESWKASLGLAAGATIAWEPSPFRPLTFEEPGPLPSQAPIRWELFELTSTHDLSREGAALRHCVRTYADDCCLGFSRIFSLRRRSTHQKLRSIATLEVRPTTRRIAQVRGFRNKAVTGRAMEVIRRWAEREGLDVNVARVV